MDVLHITKANFDTQVLAAGKPVLLDFWASWCGPCRMMAPVVEELAANRADIAVGKVNVDEEPDLAARFGIVSIPTLVVIKDGLVTAQASGVRPLADVEALLRK